MDFVMDGLATGRSIRAMAVVDSCKRECDENRHVVVRLASEVRAEPALDQPTGVGHYHVGQGRPVPFY